MFLLQGLFFFWCLGSCSSKICAVDPFPRFWEEGFRGLCQEVLSGDVIGELVVGLLVAQHLLNVSPHLVQVFLLLLSASSSSLLLTASSIMSSEQEHLVAGQNLVLHFKYPLTVFPVLLLMFSDGKPISPERDRFKRYKDAEADVRRTWKTWNCHFPLHQPSPFQCSVFLQRRSPPTWMC